MLHLLKLVKVVRFFLQHEKCDINFRLLIVETLPNELLFDSIKSLFNVYVFFFNNTLSMHHYRYQFDYGLEDQLNLLVFLKRLTNEVRRKMFLRMQATGDVERNSLAITASISCVKQYNIR